MAVVAVATATATAMARLGLVSPSPYPRLHRHHELEQTKTRIGTHQQNKKQQQRIPYSSQLHFPARRVGGEEPILMARADMKDELVVHEIANVRECELLRVDVERSVSPRV